MSFRELRNKLKTYINLSSQRDGTFVLRELWQLHLKLAQSSSTGYLYINTAHLSSKLQRTERKQERLNTPTSQQNTWTPIPNFIEIYM